MNDSAYSQIELIEECARELAAAHHAKRATAKSEVFKSISFMDAFRVQNRLVTLLDEIADVSKVGINSEGIGIYAPIYSSACGSNGHTLALPHTGFLGIEVEIAARLSRDVNPDVAAGGFDAVLSAIESFHIGVELIGTRLEKRNEAGPFAQLADNFNTFGYVHSNSPILEKTDLSNILIKVGINGAPVERTAGTSAFSNILKPIIACGRIEEREFDPLRKGMLVTTGALSGVIPVQGPATIRAGIAGFEQIEFHLV